MDVCVIVRGAAVLLALALALALALGLHLASPCGFFMSLRMGNLTSSAAGGPSSSACAAYVHELVSQNCVVIFSKTTCPYCKMAKNVFEEIGAAYKVIELDEHGDGRRLQEALAQMTGARTVPRVFINGSCIGGGSDTKQLHQEGKLLPLIQKCAPCCGPDDRSESAQ